MILPEHKVSKLLNLKLETGAKVTVVVDPKLQA